MTEQTKERERAKMLDECEHMLLATDQDGYVCCANCKLKLYQRDHDAVVTAI